MSVQVVYDRFNRSGSLASPWTVKTGDVWSLDTDTVFAIGSAATLRRAVFQPYSIYALLSGSPPQIAKRYDVYVDFTVPSTLSSTTTTYCGIELVSPGANTSGNRIEIIWYRESGGTQSIRMRIVDQSGAVTNNVSTTNITALSASSVNSLRIRVEIGNQGVQTLFVRPFLNGAPVTTGIYFGSGTGYLNYSTIPHYTGIVSYTPGPVDSSGNPQFPIKFDNFQIVDVGDLAIVAPLFTEPTLASDPVLTPMVLSSQDNSTGDSLPYTPEFTELPEEYVTTEFNTILGHTITHTSRSTPVRIWNLRFVLSKTEHDAFLTWFRTVKTNKVFTHVSPINGETLKLRFTGEIRVGRAGVDVTEFTASAEQINA